MKNNDPKWLRGEIIELRKFITKKNQEVSDLRKHVRFLEITNRTISGELKKLKDAAEAEPTKSWSFSLFGWEWSLTIGGDENAPK